MTEQHASLTFKTGDVVVLNSGGALMTVEFVGLPGQGGVSCVWHDENGRSDRARYVAECLQHHVPKSTDPWAGVPDTAPK